MVSKRTHKLPWYKVDALTDEEACVAGGTPPSIVYVDEDGENGDVLENITDGDCDLIVRAVNSHDDLLAACEAVLRLGGELDKAGIINDPAINAVRAAVAKANGVEAGRKAVG